MAKKRTVYSKVDVSLNSTWRTNFWHLRLRPHVPSSLSCSSFVQSLDQESKLSFGVSLIDVRPVFGLQETRNVKALRENGVDERIPAVQNAAEDISGDSWTPDLQSERSAGAGLQNDVDEIDCSEDGYGESAVSTISPTLCGEIAGKKTASLQNEEISSSLEEVNHSFIQLILCCFFCYFLLRRTVKLQRALQGEDFEDVATVQSLQLPFH